MDGISLSIKGGQKIGICGRSGSGKSSLVSALFRLLDLSGGKIIIDDVDIAYLPRDEVRSRLIALPQEADILPGSMRFNVDPMQACSDDEILLTLEKVGLSQLSLHDGLDTILSPEMLSHGQGHLLCLARAMVRKGCILVLDEATARFVLFEFGHVRNMLIFSKSIDVETDKLIQTLIRSHFHSHTIIAVAHRLDTIIDFDAVAIMDKGRIVEFDSPAALLEQDSMFKKLYQIQKGVK